MLSGPAIKIVFSFSLLFLPPSTIFIFDSFLNRKAVKHHRSHHKVHVHNISKSRLKTVHRLKQALSIQVFCLRVFDSRASIDQMEWSVTWTRAMTVLMPTKTPYNRQETVTTTSHILFFSFVLFCFSFGRILLLFHCTMNYVSAWRISNALN